MKRRLSKTLLNVILLVSTTSVFAQVAIDAQIRPRTEYRHGFKKPTVDGDDPAIFTEQRSRLNFEYKQEHFRTYVSLQDVRIWGEVGQINKADGLTSIHQAYGDLYMGNTTLRVGRQEFVYNDSRVLGNLGWAAQARSHDAVLLMVEDSTWKFHLAGTYNQSNSPREPGKLQSPTGNVYDPSPVANTLFNLPYPKTTQFAWFDKSFSSGNISLLAINDGIQTSDSTLHWRQTLGVIPSFDIGKISLFGSFYYQMGQVNDDISNSGFLAHAQATYKTGGAVTPTVGFDYVSGDDKSTDDIEGFNPLYGTHHLFYGLMDYFYVGNGHNGGGTSQSGGLVDLYAKAMIKTSEKSKLAVALHQFFSPTDIPDPEDPEGTLSSGLGTELDLVFIKPLNPNVMFKMGYSQMFSTESMDVAKGTMDSTGWNNWAWVMIDFTVKEIFGGDKDYDSIKTSK